MTTLRAVVAAIVGILACAPELSAAPSPTCATRVEGDVAVRETTTLVRRKPRIVVTRTESKNLAAKEATAVVQVKKGASMVTEVVATFAADGSVSLSRRFGKGFKGIAEVVYRRTGSTVALTVDGRQVSPGALATDPPSLVFEDGGRVPRLRIKRATLQLLRKASQASLTCPATAPGTLSPRDQVNDPFETECDTCNFKCFAEGYACMAAPAVGCAFGPVGCAAGAIVNLVQSGRNCGSGYIDCVDKCKSPGNECCRAACGTDCCGAPLEHDVVAGDYTCAGASPDFAGICCAKGWECGPSCCAPGQCANPQTGLCCKAGESGCGTGCCSTTSGKCTDPARSQCCPIDGDGCGGYCCPSGKRCKTPSEDFDEVVCIDCPASKSGPVCGDACCGPNETCGFGNECCPAGNLCGGTCCSAEYCLNGTTCCKPPNSRICGANCCPSFSTCCNGQCCNGECVGGVCCPANRTCGTTCCPAGYACSDTAGGTCEPCGAGSEPCAPLPGNPLCCPGGTECCTGEQCCAAGTACCTPVFGGALGCYSPEACVR